MKNLFVGIQQVVDDGGETGSLLFLLYTYYQRVLVSIISCVPFHFPTFSFVFLFSTSRTMFTYPIISTHPFIHWFPHCSLPLPLVGVLTLTEKGRAFRFIHRWPLLMQLVQSLRLQRGHVTVSSLLTHLRESGSFVAMGAVSAAPSRSISRHPSRPSRCHHPPFLPPLTPCSLPSTPFLIYR